MKRFILCLGLLGLVSTAAHAGIMLSSNPLSGTPADTFLLQVSSTTGTDIMAGWQLDLLVSPDPGATGAVTFANAQIPPNYIFANDLGLTTTNLGNELKANDFDAQLLNNPPGGTTVPMAPNSANLLSVHFDATGAAGTFGLYAVRGKGNTEWTDPAQNDNFFDNVPDGTGMIRLGEIVVVAAIPEPASWALFAIGGVIFAWLKYPRPVPIRCPIRSLHTRP